MFKSITSATNPAFSRCDFKTAGPTVGALGKILGTMQIMISKVIINP